MVVCPLVFAIMDIDVEPRILGKCLDSQYALSSSSSYGHHTIEDCILTSPHSCYHQGCKIELKWNWESYFQKVCIESNGGHIFFGLLPKEVFLQENLSLQKKSPVHFVNLVHVGHCR